MARNLGCHSFNHYPAIITDIHEDPECFKDFSAIIYHPEPLVAIAYHHIIRNGGGQATYYLTIEEIVPRQIRLEDIILTTREIFSQNRHLRQLKMERPHLQIFPLHLIHFYAVFKMDRPDIMQGFEMTLQSVPEFVDLTISDPE